jgi:hypothetical protein
MRTSRFCIVILIVAMAAGCATGGGPVPRGKEADQVPMYGGMDRQSVPQLKKADDEFIVGTTKAFGSREKASEAFVDQGIRFYQADNYDYAMRRFNQAWLLNPENPNVFWGFGMVLHDEGKVCDAKEMMDRAIELNLSKPIAVADAARIYTLCGQRANRWMPRQGNCTSRRRRRYTRKPVPSRRTTTISSVHGQRPVIGGATMRGPGRWSQRRALWASFFPASS